MKSLPAILLATAILTLARCAALAQSPAPAQSSPGLALPSASAPSASPSSSLALPSTLSSSSAQSLPSSPATEEPPADPDTAFTTGLAAYENGDYPTARKNFAAAERTATSFALEYNLGNACYQTGDQAAAILHYLRALVLNPRDPDARQNLALARQALNLSVPDPDFLTRLSDSLSVNAWAWILVIFGWAAAYLLFLPRLWRWRGAAPWLLFAASLAIAGIAFTALVQAHLHSHDGVILHADSQFKLSPTSSSQAIGVLQAGEIAEALEQYNGYYKVRAADGRLGWISSLSYAPVYD